jgi:diketogulonate reductase-like aldo/keto reductase
MAAPATEIRTTKLPSGVAVPVLGQGTWHFGENPARRA